MTPFLVAQAALPGATPDLVPPVWRMAAGLCLVLALLLLLGWVLRRGLAARRGSTGISVESAHSLGDRRSVVIVSVEGRRLLLGVGQAQVSLLTELRGASFDQALSQASRPESRP